MLTLQKPPNNFTKRFSVMDCMIIKKNHEVTESLTGRKINLTVFRPLILRNILLKKFLIVSLVTSDTRNHFLNSI